jgi:hypothetical protein
VSKVDWIAEHERTTSDDAVDAACLALANGLLRHTTVAEGTVEPNLAYAMLAALLYDVDRDSRMSRDYDAINWNRDRGQVRITAYAFHFRALWIDRKDLISAILQLMIDSVGCLARFTGNTRHRNTPASKKLGY